MSSSVNTSSNKENAVPLAENVQVISSSGSSTAVFIPKNNLNKKLKPNYPLTQSKSTTNFIERNKNMTKISKKTTDLGSKTSYTFGIGAAIKNIVASSA